MQIKTLMLMPQLSALGAQHHTHHPATVSTHPSHSSSVLWAADHTPVLFTAPAGWQSSPVSCPVVPSIKSIATYSVPGVWTQAGSSPSQIL